MTVLALCAAILGLTLVSADDPCSLEADDLLIASSAGEGEPGLWLELLRLKEADALDEPAGSARVELAIAFLYESSAPSIGGGSSATKVVHPAAGCEQPWLERRDHRWKLAEDPASPATMTREIVLEMLWDGRNREFTVEQQRFRPNLDEGALFVVVLDEDWQPAAYEADVSLDGLPIEESSKERISSALEAVRGREP